MGAVAVRHSVHFVGLPVRAARAAPGRRRRVPPHTARHRLHDWARVIDYAYLALAVHVIPRLRTVAPHLF